MAQIRVLIVEDSKTSQVLLSRIINSDPRLTVVGTASDGIEALEFLEREKPDVVTLDIHMPRMNGAEFTKKVMATNPVPIVVVSVSWQSNDVNLAFQCLEAGALCALEKPTDISNPRFKALRTELTETVKAMSEVKLVRRGMEPRGDFPAPSRDDDAAAFRVIAIGASTGGPLALKALLSDLPNDLPVPIVIVQHMLEAFVDGMCVWLAKKSSWRVCVAKHDELLESGCAYIAPCGKQLSISRDNRIRLTDEAPENGAKPSVSHLFRSITEVYGKNSIGVILSGMGVDGARELALMRDAGAITFAQDEASSVVFGMPSEAIQLNGACYTHTPAGIASMISDLFKPTARRTSSSRIQENKFKRGPNDV